MFFRKTSRSSLPGGNTNLGPQSAPMLVTLSDFPDGFDDKHIVDVCISAPGGTGTAQRLLSRQRQTLRAAVQQAGVHAEQLAQASGETIVAPGQRPSIAHLADGEGGSTICLSYDVGLRSQLRLRVVRTLRIFVVVRHEGSTESLSPAPSTRSLPPSADPRSRPPPA